MHNNYIIIYNILIIIILLLCCSLLSYYYYCITYCIYGSILLLLSLGDDDDGHSAYSSLKGMMMSCDHYINTYDRHLQHANLPQTITYCRNRKAEPCRSNNTPFSLATPNDK